MRAMGLDVGDRRIGVAISDPTGLIASPVTTIHRESERRDQQVIAGLVEVNAVEVVVLGLPKTLRGEIGPQAQKVMRFGDSLSRLLDVPLEYWNETYSTLDAEEIISARGARRRRGRPGRIQLDEVAAAVILQGYLDNRRRSESGQ